MAIVVLGTATAAAQNSTGGELQAGPEGNRRVTIEQVRQQAAANRAFNPLARLGQLSIEAARQHRLGVQADYYPKFGASFVNLHYTDFLGTLVTSRRSFFGAPLQATVPIFSENQTAAMLTFTQPITPILQVHQLVKIARADERIAMAKAGVAVTRNMREREIEETYFKLLIAQRRLVSAEWRLRSSQNRPLYASTSIQLAGTSLPDAELAETTKVMFTASTEVKELTASLNRVMGWPEDTQLELVIPEPLVEDISLQDVADKPAVAAPELIEAQQTVVKARAAATLSKLAYVPTVAAISGYMFQNIIPAVSSNYGYGGVVVSYNLFDFGKRERAVKEARAQLEMAELGVQLTRAKISGNLTKSYYELERSRQLSKVAQKMGTSVLMNVRATSENAEIRAARADLEVEMLEADLAHRQAFARLTALMVQ
jgi:hypothetical protein